MHSSLADLTIYSKPEPPAQFLVNYQDFFGQNMPDWCQNVVGNKRFYEARRMIPHTEWIPVWFKRDIDALAFKLAFNDYVRENK